MVELSRPWTGAKMMVTTITQCNVSEYVSTRHIHAKEKVICALLGISGCLRQKELSQTAFLTQPIGMEAKAAVVLVLREESILEGCSTWGPRPHICVYSHGGFSGYTCKSHLETGHQWCCHNPSWAVPSEGTGRLLFLSQVV
jgi:hypothetical protein